MGACFHPVLMPRWVVRDILAAFSPTTGTPAATGKLNLYQPAFGLSTGFREMLLEPMFPLFWGF